MKPLVSFQMFACFSAAVAVGYWVNLYLGLVLFATGILIASSAKMADDWQKFAGLRHGKLQRLRGTVRMQPHR